jgi:hypothetical protein
MGLILKLINAIYVAILFLIVNLKKDYILSKTKKIKLFYLKVKNVKIMDNVKNVLTNIMFKMEFVNFV